MQLAMALCIQPINPLSGRAGALELCKGSPALKTGTITA